MKPILWLTVITLCVSTGFLATAAGTNVPTFVVSFNGAFAFQVLNIYTNMTGLQLDMDTNAKAMSDAQIDMHISGPVTKDSKDETIKLMEKTLKEQAGLVITHLDDKTARVTFDPAVRIARPASAMAAAREKIIITAADVVPKSVRLITGPDIPRPNLHFRYVGKTSDEIKAIQGENPQVQVVKDGAVVATAEAALYEDKPAHYVGLVLIFDDDSAAKLAEKTLRGE